MVYMQFVFTNDTISQREINGICGNYIWHGSIKLAR